MTKRYAGELATLIAFVLLPQLAFADGILFEVSGTASGSIGGDFFFDELVTISGFGDTDDVMTSGNLSTLFDDFTASVQIGDLVTAEFTDAIQAVANTNTELAGFGNTTAGQGLVFVNSDQFADYDLRSEIGPVSGFAVFNFLISHATTEGNLVFTDADGVDGQFTASFAPIPEPTAAAILLIPLALLRRPNRG